MVDNNNYFPILMGCILVMPLLVIAVSLFFMPCPFVKIDVKPPAPYRENDYTELLQGKRYKEEKYGEFREYKDES